MHLPRRILARIALCLTLGLLTTFAIAWIAVLRPTVAHPAATHASRPLDLATGEPLGHLSLSRYDTPLTSTYIARVDFAGWEPTTTRPSLKPEQIVPTTVHRIVLPWVSGRAPWPKPDESVPGPLRERSHTREAQTAGWPMRALWCTYTWTNTSGGYVKMGSGGIQIDRRRLWNNEPYRLVLPCRVIPLGLIGDILFYATLWSLLLFIPRTIRRHLRRRRGHCPRCNYDLRTSPPSSPCPECGTKPVLNLES